MPNTAQARYRIAALLWAAVISATVLALDLPVGVMAILRSAAVIMTIGAMLVERDERICKTIDLAYWAGTVAGREARESARHDGA